MAKTTHLVCAPDDLPASAIVSAWLAPVGSELAADAPLVRLRVGDSDLIVAMPLAGWLTSYCAAVGESLMASELLAMVEADEPEFGMADTESLSSSGLPPFTAPTAATSSDDFAALQLCANLGVAPDEVRQQAGGLSVADVHSHVRRELRTLQALRELLAR